MSNQLFKDLGKADPSNTADVMQHLDELKKQLEGRRKVDNRQELFKQFQEAENKVNTDINAQSNQKKKDNQRKKKTMSDLQLVAFAQNFDRGNVPLAHSYSELKVDLLEAVKKDESLEMPKVKFVDKKNEDQIFQDHIALASFPRSGNTLLRAYLEKIMGLATGSDGDISRRLIKELMDKGLVGEGLAGHRVQVVKTHFPERYGPNRFNADRAILLTRNPLDCLTSFFNMLTTATHDLSIDDKEFDIAGEEFAQKWDMYVRQEITVWNEFHMYWLNTGIPVFLVSYEELSSNPEPILKKLLEFVLNVDDITGTTVHQYLKQAVKEEPPKVYTPREGKINSNRSRFTKKQIDFFTSYAGENIRRLGYFQSVTG